MNFPEQEARYRQAFVFISSTFRDIHDRQRQQQEPRSVTDLEIRYAVLDQRRNPRTES